MIVLVSNVKFSLDVHSLAYLMTSFSALMTERNVEGLRAELETAHHHLERNANPKVLFMDLSYRLMGLLRA